MFFILSKILDFLISPLTWIVLIIIISFLIKKEPTKKKLQLSGFILLLFFSSPMVYNICSLVIPTVPFNKKMDKSYASGIVLGGMISYDESSDNIFFNSNVNRITQAIELYKKGVIMRIIISGGSGSITYPEKREAALLKKYIIRYFSIPDSVVSIENKSNNTFENAFLTKKLLKELKLEKEKHLLITSALHQYRAYNCFKKQGIKTIYYKKIRRNNREKSLPKNTFLPQAETLLSWDNLFHELIGISFYKLMDYV